MANFADRIADAILSHTVDLSRYDVDLRAQIVGMLEELRDELTLRLSRTDPTSGRTESSRVKRQQQLLQDASKTIKKAYKGIAEHSEASLFNVGEVVVKGTAKKLSSLVGVDITSAALSPATLKALVNSEIVLGAPAGEWWDKQGQNTRDSFIRQIRLGMMGGENLGQLLQRIRGEHTGRYVTVQNAEGKRRKVPEFTGGVLSTSTREATALIRTSVQSVANAARMELYDKNPDVIKGVQALVTLDGRTSDICKARSGKAWFLDGRPMQGTTGFFPGPPPWHFNCRSTLIPVMKSWSELAGPKSKLSKKQIDALEAKTPPDSQASMDGQVAGDLTYGEWLKSKPEAFQRQVLGAGRYELWKAGKIEFSDLIDQSGNPLTMEQLREAFGVSKLSEFTLPEIELVGKDPSNRADEIRRQVEETLVDLDERLPKFREVYQGSLKGVYFLAEPVADKMPLGLFYPDTKNITLQLVRTKDFSKEKQTFRPRAGSGFFTVGNGSTADVLTHEIGHAIHFNRPASSMEPEWVKIWKEIKDKPGGWEKAVSKYAATNHKEAFAESFAAYAHPGYKSSAAKKLPARIDEYFRNLLGEPK